MKFATEIKLNLIIHLHSLRIKKKNWKKIGNLLETAEKEKKFI